MKKNVHRNSLLIYISFPYIILAIISILIILYFVYNSKKNELTQTFIQNKNIIELNIRTAFEYRNSGMNMLDKALDEEMEDAFIPFHREYENSGRRVDKMNLLKVKKELDNKYELYIINKKGVIEYATLKDSIGLDLSQFGILDLLTHIRLEKKFVPDQINIDVVYGDLKKWAYYGSVDGEWLFEIGLNSDAFKKYIEEMDPRKLIPKFKSINPEIIDIKIYDPSGFLIGDPEYKIEDSIMTNIKFTAKYKTNYTIVNKKNEIQYFYIDLSIPNGLSDPSVVVEINYTKEILKAKLDRLVLNTVVAGILITLIIIIISVIISAGLTKPIKKIIDDISVIAKGDYKHVINAEGPGELFELESSIKIMVEEITDKIEKLKESENALKKANDNLELTVEERTMHLKEALEELNKFKNNTLNDLKLCRLVQKEIIPSSEKIKLSECLEAVYYYQSMESVGGDLIDVLKMNEDRYGFLVADVSGHGIAAALVTAMIKFSFFYHSRNETSPAKICESVNNDLFPILNNSGLYFTANFVAIDIKEEKLYLSSAGHPPALLLHKENDSILELKSAGTFIGIFENMKYENIEFKLENGDILILYTDGLIEIRNKQGEFFDIKGIIEILNKNKNKNINEIATDIEKTVNDFGKYSQNKDDQAMIIIKYKKQF